MEESILTSTKKILGIFPSDDAFDLDIITHINSSFSTLTQLGVGPETGFEIEDASTKWEDIFPDLVSRNLIKTYIFLKVKMLFDMPTTSYTLTATKEELREQEWRISERRESIEWRHPEPTVIEDE